MTLTRPRYELAALQLVLLLGVTFLVLCGFAAHAQTVLVAPAAAGAPGGPAWVTALIQYCLVPAIPVLGTLTVWVLTKLATFLHTKGENSKVAGAFAVAVDFIETAFTHLRAGIEADLKLALADGTLDAKERADLVAKLVSLVKAELPGSIMGVLSGALGPSLETWLNGKAGDAIQKVVVATATPGELAVAQFPR